MLKRRVLDRKRQDSPSSVRALVNLPDYVGYVFCCPSDTASCMFVCVGRE